MKEIYSYQELRADLIALSCARLPVPQANGAWVPTRPGHERTRRVAAEFGLTHAEHCRRW